MAKSSSSKNVSGEKGKSNMVRTLKGTPTGKVVGCLAAVALVAVVWVGSQLPASGGSTGGGAALTTAAAASDLTGSAAEGGANISDAAYRAAKSDAARGTSEQRSHLDPSTFEQVTVRHVVDGDTIAVKMPDGQHVSVRMVGIDTPESVAPQEERNCQEGVLASDHMKALVSEGDTLWLQYDTSVTDKYDRPLAYVWRELPGSATEADDPAVIARSMLNAIQVIDGYGQAKTYRPDTYHDGLFAQWGDEALADGRGVTYKWA